MLAEPWGLIHRVLFYSRQGYDVLNNMCHTEYIVEKLMVGLLYKVDRYTWIVFITVFNYHKKCYKN